jgi:hypothetical protein
VASRISAPNIYHPKNGANRLTRFSFLCFLQRVEVGTSPLSAGSLSLERGRSNNSSSIAMNDVGWLLSMALVSCVSFYLGVGFGSSTVSQTSPIVLSDTPARSEGPIQIQSNTVPLTNITGGNIPSELTEIRSHFYAMITNPTSEAAGSLDAAYFHMLQIRAGANFHRFGSTVSITLMCRVYYIVFFHH